MKMMPTKTSAKLTILGAAAALALFGCAAPQQQTAIPPSPTGCYAAMPITTLYGFPITQPRYEPAPCNVINANQPPQTFQTVVEPPPLNTGAGAWSIAGPGGVASGSGGSWSGAGPGWAGSGVGGTP